MKKKDKKAPTGQLIERYENVADYIDVATGQVVRQVTFHSNGRVKMDIPMRDGAPNGKLMEYYRNGNLKRDEQFKDGQRNGIRNNFYATGSLERIAHYVSGEKEGWRVHFAPWGHVDSCQLFKNNNPCESEKIISVRALFTEGLATGYDLRTSRPVVQPREEAVEVL